LCRIHLLTSSSRGAARHPAYYVDGPYAANEILESNVDTLGRPCPAYRIYGFPAYYGAPLQPAAGTEMVPGCYYDVPACVGGGGGQGPAAALACAGRAEYGAPPPGEEVFIDGPPAGRGGPSEGTGGGRRRTRPPTEGSDSETTPVRTLNGPVRKRSDHDEKNDTQRNEAEAEDEGTYVDFRGTVRPENHDAGKRPDHEDESARRAARPDGQSPDSGGGIEPATTTESGRTTTASCSTLSDLDNRLVVVVVVVVVVVSSPPSMQTFASWRISAAVE